MDLMARRRAIMGMPSGEEYTISNANVISISDALAKNAKSLIVSFSPKQSGSGDPSPDNVRPISGYNDIGAVRYGKNLLSMHTYSGIEYNPTVGTVVTLTDNPIQFTDNGNGTFTLNTTATWQYYSLIVPIRYGLSLHLNLQASSTGTIRATRGYLDEDFKVLTKSNTTSAPISFDFNLNVEQNAKYYYILITNASTKNVTITVTNPQLEVGLSFISYEPYISPVTANVHSDTTLFGGTVDLVSGECVVDRAIVDLGTLNWYYVTTGTYPFFESGTITGANKDKGCLCSAYKGIMAQSGTYWRDGSHPQEIGFNKSGGSPYVRVQDSDYTDATSFKTAVSGVILCYELATPITYQLTPSQLSMLKGNNTVYSNEGSITLTYVGK